MKSQRFSGWLPNNLLVSRIDKLEQDFFKRSPVICARELVGMHLRWENCEGRIVETEAYAEFGDEACHTFSRPSARDFVSEKQAGTAYVYLNYGMYWLTNVLCKSEDGNGFVLIRALEPVSGIDLMKERRNKSKETDLCSGPGKLSIAMGITGDDHGTDFITGPDGFFHSENLKPKKVMSDVRIGISKAVNRKWRFLEKGNPHVSVPPRNPIR